MKRRTGFSLIEILVVLGIMGLIAGMLMPAAGLVRERANQMVTGQKLRQIGLSYVNYASNKGAEGAINARSVAEWVDRFISLTGLSEGEYYFFAEDPLLMTTDQKVPDDLRYLKPREMVEWSKYFGVTVTSPFRTEGHKNPTPILWTRGLGRDGYWSDGVYGDSGGFILFSNGRVRYFRDLHDEGGVLRDYRTGERVSDIQRALPSGTVVLK